jgi:hypothetical protein
VVIDYRLIIDKLFKRAERNGNTFKGKDWRKFVKLTEWEDNESIESLQRTI